MHTLDSPTALVVLAALLALPVQVDLRACVPRLSGGAREWLLESLRLLYLAGHPWIELLSG